VTMLTTPHAAAIGTCIHGHHYMSIYAKQILLIRNNNRRYLEGQRRVPARRVTRRCSAFQPTCSDNTHAEDPSHGLCAVTSKNYCYTVGNMKYDSCTNYGGPDGAIMTQSDCEAAVQELAEMDSRIVWKGADGNGGMSPGCVIANAGSELHGYFITHTNYDITRSVDFLVCRNPVSRPPTEPVRINALPAMGSYFGTSLPNERPLWFELVASINRWNSYLVFSQDRASGKRNFAAALIFRNGNFRWNDIADNKWGNERDITSSPVRLRSTFRILGLLRSNNVVLTINGVRTQFSFRNSLDVNFFMVTSAWHVEAVLINENRRSGRRFLKN